MRHIEDIGYIRNSQRGSKLKPWWLLESLALSECTESRRDLSRDIDIPDG
jgi:hypothetical protein